jgi:hypothetical protein
MAVNTDLVLLLRFNQLKLLSQLPNVDDDVPTCEGFFGFVVDLELLLEPRDNLIW